MAKTLPLDLFWSFLLPIVSKPVEKTLRHLSAHRATPITPGTLAPTTLGTKTAVKAIIRLFLFPIYDI